MYLALGQCQMSTWARLTATQIMSLYFAASRNNELESKSQLTIKVRDIREVAKNIPRGGTDIFGILTI